MARLLRTLGALAAMLAAGAFARPAAAGGQEPPDYFVDASGARTAFRPVYEGWFGDRRPPPHYGRALLENVGLLGFELFVYWYDPGSNIVDWQFPSLGWKVTSSDSVRFDDNMPRTNWLLHPFAGATHYGLTRINGLGIPASFAAAALSSGVYEIVIEWREVVSINDLVVTPFGGMALGEFMFHLGDYANSRPERPRTLDVVVGPASFARELAAGTVGLPRKLHEIADEPPPPLLVPDDELGLSSAYAHRFRLMTGGDLLRDDAGRAGGAAVVGAEAELAAMPGFMRPGRIGTWFWNGNFTSMETRASFDELLRELDVRLDAHLFGHYAQRFEPAAGGLTGGASELSAHTALHYVDRWLLGRRDHYDVLSVLGPTATVWIGSGGTMVRLSADASPDFAAPGSLAYERWGALYGTEGTKSSLLAHGYYNAWGLSAGASAAVSAHGVTASARGRYGHYESIDGAERARRPVTREVHDADDILELEGRCVVEPPGTNLTTGLTAADVVRRSRMAPVTISRSDQRLGFFVGIRF